MRSVIMALALVLTGCGGEEKTEQPTDRSISFRLYPSDFFDTGYKENYAASGTVKNGSNITTVAVSFSNKANGLTSFNSSQAQSVYGTVSISEASTGAFIATSGTEYYSSDPNHLSFLGSVQNGVYTTAKSNSVIPITAKIGDFGSIGEYVNTANSNIKTMGWELQDGNNGNAKMCITTTTTDTTSIGTTINESGLVCYLITPEGYRLSMSFDFTNYQEGIIAKISGDREE